MEKLKKTFAYIILASFGISFVYTIAYVIITTGWGVLSLILAALLISWLLIFAVTTLDK